MTATPNTRHRHALRWVLGVGLVFVVVVGMALQEARRRADERWNRVYTHCLKEMHIQSVKFKQRASGLGSFLFVSRGGGFFRDSRLAQLHSLTFSIELRQERSFFGSTFRARLSGGKPEEIAEIRAIFAELDIELVVEP